MTEQKYVSVSRPFRFGKSMAADMIRAYYDRDIRNDSLEFNHYTCVIEGHRIYESIPALEVMPIPVPDYESSKGALRNSLTEFSEK